MNIHGYCNERFWASSRLRLTYYAGRNAGRRGGVAFEALLLVARDRPGGCRNTPDLETLQGNGKEPLPRSEAEILFFFFPVFFTPRILITPRVQVGHLYKHTLCVMLNVKLVATSVTVLFLPS